MLVVTMMEARMYAYVSGIAIAECSVASREQSKRMQLSSEIERKGSSVSLLLTLYLDRPSFMLLLVT